MTNTKIITVNWPIFTHAELNPASPPATTEGRKKAKADDEAAELATSPKGTRNGPVIIVADGAIGDPDDLPNRSLQERYYASSRQAPIGRSSGSSIPPIASRCNAITLRSNRANIRFT